MSEAVNGGRYGIQQFSDGVWSETMIWLGYRRRADAERVAQQLNTQIPGRFRVSDKRGESVR